MEDKREYSAIEIEIAEKLLEKGFEWIARDKDDDVYAYCTRPVKGGKAWLQEDDLLLLMSGGARGVIPIFDGIRWEDEEPVRLRDIVPQILTDEEREWLRTGVKPFRDRLKSVEAHDGVFYGRYVAFAIEHPEEFRDGLLDDEEDSPLPVPKDWFKGMEDRKEYTPEELGL